MSDMFFRLVGSGGGTTITIFTKIAGQTNNLLR